MCLNIDAGDFRKQQQEINHWTEWKHWVHARAVESHDFEDDRSVSMFEHTNMMSASAPHTKRARVHCIL